jgi:hypothetical protein
MWRRKIHARFGWENLKERYSWEGEVVDDGRVILRDV